MRLLALALCALSAYAQFSPAQQAAFEKIAASHQERVRIPALSIAIQSGDSPAFTYAAGFSDLENFVPATPKTVFRLGSISKPLTAVAALQLVEDGKLDLDLEIQHYLPSYPRKPWPITTRQLLSHLAGIRHYEGDEISSTKHYSSVQEGLAIFAKDPLLHEPGTKYSYSSYGYNVAGAVLEAACGRSYSDCVRSLVLHPAGMEATRPDHLYALIPFRARGYFAKSDGTLENCGLADTSYKIPGGGWLSTAPDLARFAHSLISAKLLKPVTLEKMWTSNRLKDGGISSYGLGWNLSTLNGTRVVFHSGGQQGTSTYLLIAPEKKLTVVVLCNLEGGPAKQIAEALFAEALSPSI